jgi:DNA processing protein
LSGPLDRCARDRDRLAELLTLPDERLIEAVGGTRSAQLASAHARLDLPRTRERGRALDMRVESVCVHDSGFPASLKTDYGPALLEVAGGGGRLAGLAGTPAVAIAGTRAPSDYGAQVARCLGRGLAVSGVTVTASVSEGVALAALAGACDAGGRAIAVTGTGLRRTVPVRCRPVRERVGRCGCVVSELPGDCDGRRWGWLAGERIVAALAQVVVIVEADDTRCDLAVARWAQLLDRRVAAVPGRVTSPLARGTTALLRDGADLVADPRDVLELLYLTGGDVASHPVLEPRLRELLERVGCGFDTPERLWRDGEDPAQVLMALSELELLGLLARGDGGRYVPCHPLAARGPAIREANEGVVQQMGDTCQDLGGTASV